MNLDKFNKAVWSIIGAFILLGILLSVGGVVLGIIFNAFSRHNPDGIQAPTAQISKEEESYVLKAGYEMPLLIEGSDFFVVPVSLKKVSNAQKTEYWSRVKSDSESWGVRGYSEEAYMNYNYFGGPCFNLIFIDKKSGKADRLLNEKAYIDSVFFPQKKYLPEEKPQPEFILLKIAKTDTNQDGTINDKDALAGDLVDLDGKNLTQITPSGTNMVFWQYDQDSKKLFVKIVEDVNGDKKFTEEDGEKTLMIDSEAPVMGREFVPEEIKKSIESII